MFLLSVYILLISFGYCKVERNYIGKFSETHVENHVYLASDVKDYFRASSVFNVYQDNNSDMSVMLSIFRLSRVFSNNNVLSQSMRLNNIPEYLQYYSHRTLSPLYVVTLRSQQDMEAFGEFAKNFSMSLNLWLIFMYSSKEVLEYCHNPIENLFNVAFDTKILVKCSGDPILREWYSIHKNEVKVNDVAMWTRENRFIIINQASVWQRRKTLEGIDIRIATVKESVFAVSDIERNRGTLYGLFGNALRELADVINFTAVLVSTEDMYGSYHAEYNNWTGVIGCLVKNKVDIGVAEFGRSKHRLEAVDFTVPLLLTRMNLYFRQPNMSAIMWSTYIQVFDTRIWISSFALLGICTFIISFIMTRTVKYRFLALTIDNLFFVWGIHCQQGLPEFPTVSSLKLAFLSLLISSMVIYIGYSATLTSYLAAFTPSLPFNSEQEFLTDTSYNLSVLRGSVYHDLFERASDPAAAQMRNRLKRVEDLPYNMLEAIDQVCSEKVVMYTNEIFIHKIGASIPCPLMAINTGRLDSAAFTLTKRSPYRGIVNYHIENFRSYGIIKVLKSRHLQKAVTKESIYSPINFWSIVPILTIFFSGIIVAILILMCENIHYFSRVKRRQKILINKKKIGKINRY